MLTKLLRGNDRSDRTTRFHVENGPFVGWRALRHLPHAIVSYARRRATGEPPLLPWWSYPAITRIARALRPDSVVLEYGTGMSTLWLAKRVALVYAVEDSREWADRVRLRAGELHLSNIELVLREQAAYGAGSFPSAFAEPPANGPFDLVVVDGAARWLCVEATLPLLRPGGLLYLDNSDADKDLSTYPDPGMRQEARRRLLDAERAGAGSLEFLRGFPPATLHATEGMLFTARGAAGPVARRR